MQLVIDLPDHVGKWLNEKAEQDFRTVEQMASVFILKEYRSERENINSKLRECITSSS